MLKFNFTRKLRTIINHLYLNDNESQAQDLNPPDQDSQYAPTPGYYIHTPPSEYRFSPSPNHLPQDVLRKKLHKVIEEKVTRKRRVKSDDISILMSINDRKQRNLKKRFNGLTIN
ncbi:unnamed protein product [Penicillium salamii]|nr:unnamed protein product [Penicillium salamii]